MYISRQYESRKKCRAGVLLTCVAAGFRASAAADTAASLLFCHLPEVVLHSDIVAAFMLRVNLPPVVEKP